MSAVGAWAQPVVSPQIRVDTTTGVSATNETTMAASEANTGVIVGGWNDYRQAGNVRVGACLSTDGGLTWTDFLLRPPAGNQTSVEGDPMTAFDNRTGDVWVGGISFAGNGGLFVARKRPQDADFGTPVMARVGFVDKGWMAIGPDPLDMDETRIYITYNEGIVISDDFGASWSSPRSLGFGLGYLPRVGPNGELYIAYWDVSDGVVMRRSFDGGRTISGEITIATRMDVWDTQSGIRFPGSFRVPSLNYLAVDPTTGTLYCVYFDTTDFDGGRANVDLYFTKSTDQGDSWTTPVVINEDAPTPGDQFFPWLEVTRNGRIHMLFYDTRNVVQNDGGGNAFIDAYYSYSDDEGDTWTETRLTPNSWESRFDGLGGGFIGDYLGGAVAGSRFWPLYLDTQVGDASIYTHVIADPVGDLNNDCTVDIEDLSILLGNFGTPSGADLSDGDTDFDGDVDIEDLTRLLADFGSDCP